LLSFGAKSFCLLVCYPKNVKIKIHRNIILLAVLYGCETWSLTLKEERRLRMSENRVLRIFVPKRDEVTGVWRKLHNGELHDLYSSPTIVRVIKSRGIKWAGHVALIGERGGVYRVLVGKTEEKRPLGRPRRRWEIILRWIIKKDRDRWRVLVNAVMNLRFP
jgi:hypothetical protein